MRRFISGMGIALSSLVICGLGAADATIELSDFKRDFYHCSYGNNTVTGSAQNGIAPDGSKTVKVNYDFSQCKSFDNSFLRFHMDRVMPAKPKSVILEVYNPDTKPLLLTAFTVDAGGEVYLGRATTSKSGEFETVKLDISPTPAWAGGDNNNRIDYPLSWANIMVEMHPKGSTQGEFFIKSAKIVSAVDAECCLAMVLDYLPANYGTNQIPFKVKINALDPAIAGDYQLKINFVDNYSGKPAAEYTFPIRLPLSGNNTVIEVPVKLPFGSYSGQAQLLTAKGKVMEKKEISCQILTQSCSIYANDNVKKFEYQYGVNGGVHGFITPENAAPLGMNWIRFEWPNWQTVETSPGVYDTANYRNQVMPWINQNIRVSLLQCHYHYPTFVNPKDAPEFSRQYGQYFKHLMPAVKDVITEFELGNEDNGHNKFLYTESARNAAAAIRSASPFAVIGNSGTAFVDTQWLKMQSSRKLNDYHDAYVVHPYTNNAAASQAVSPEIFGTVNYLENLIAAALESGGMKDLWITEFGWPNGTAAEERDRAMLYLREMLIFDQADILYGGLYTWDRDYGIVNRPAGAAIHNYAKMRQGAIFVGSIIRNDIYCNVYDAPAAGPFAVVWTPANDPKTMPYAAQSYSDLFGNKTAKAQVSQSPVYLQGISPDLVKQAAAANLQLRKQRLEQLLTKINGKAKYADLLTADAKQPQRLKQLLQKYCRGEGEITTDDQSVLYLLWQLYAPSERYFGNGQGEAAPDLDHYRQTVIDLNANLLDNPALRYLIRAAQKINSEKNLNVDNQTFAAACDRELTTLDLLLQTFAERGRKVLYGAFSNAYMTHQGETGEKLYFIPGQQTKIKVRTSNYYTQSINAAVIPHLAADWTCEPAQAQIELAPGDCAWTEFTVTAPAGIRNVSPISCDTVIGQYKNTAVFDQIEILPALTARIGLVPDALDRAPLTLTVKNLESNAVKGTVKLLTPEVAGGGLAVQTIEIGPGQSQSFAIKLLPQAIAALAKANYKVNALFCLDDGRIFENRNLNVDFAAATLASNLKIDGNLGDWGNALPLKLDQIEYTRGSFGNGWTPEDCSAVTYLGYDQNNLYFAAVVKDQTFNQQMSGASLWMQDSIQLIFAKDDNSKDYCGLILAYTSAGPKIFHENKNQYLANAEIAVKLGNEMIYEARIPWSELSPELADTVKSGKFKYGIAINDDDAIVPRRFMEYFEDSIVHDKKIKNFGTVTLVQPAAILKTGSEKLVFYDDFTTYPDNTTPAGYAVRTGGEMTAANATVKTVNGGKALQLTNDTGYTANRFLILTNPMRLSPGKNYVLSVKMSGKHENPVAGVCSDYLGIQDHNYLQLPPEIAKPTVFTTEFAAPATGELNVVLRNDGKYQDFYLYEIKVTEK